MPTTSTEGAALAPGAAGETAAAVAPAEAVNVLPVDYSSGARATRFRWVILALVFFAITINYIDRNVMGLVAPEVREQFQIDAKAYGYISSAFALCYALGQAMSGRWLDWIGTRVGYAIALTAWSVVSMLHAFAGSAFGFGLMRGLLGVTESPAYPAANKTLAEWFPKKERALAMGFANAGANVGSILAPIMVLYLVKNHGWQWAFLGTGAVGLLWLIFWIPLYRRPEEHPRVSADELAYIHQDPPEPTGKIRWLRLLTFRQSWGFALGKLFTDPIWSFYLFWLPTFFKDRFNASLAGVALPMVVIYVMADVGSIGGGWLSSFLIHRGWSVNAARKCALLVSALAVVPAAFISTFSHMWTAVLVAGLALSAHQAFSSNLYTLVSDTFPRRAVGSVSGLGGTFGYLGTTLFMSAVGWTLSLTGNNYLPIFVACGAAYLVAFLIIQGLMPRLEPAPIDSTVPGGFEVQPKA
jgi:ACS family hexuronate transporter-like MFS transporter